MANKTFGSNAASNSNQRANSGDAREATGFSLPTEETSQASYQESWAPAYQEEYAPAEESWSEPVAEEASPVVGSPEPVIVPVQEQLAKINRNLEPVAVPEIDTIRPTVNQVSNVQQASVYATPDVFVAPTQAQQLAPDVAENGVETGAKVNAKGQASGTTDVEGVNNTVAMSTPGNNGSGEATETDYFNMAGPSMPATDTENVNRNVNDFRTRSDYSGNILNEAPGQAYQKIRENREEINQALDSKPMTAEERAVNTGATIDPETRGYVPIEQRPEDIGFATDERATAFDTETGEVIDPRNSTTFREDRAGFDSDPVVEEALEDVMSEGYFYSLPAEDPSQARKTENYHNKIKDEYLTGYFEIESHRVENGKVRYSDQVESAIALVSAYTGLDPVSQRREIFQVLRLNMGLFTDSEGLLFGMQKGGKVFNNAVAEASIRIKSSMTKFGHPFGYVEQNETLHVGRKIPCFPVAVVDDELLTTLAASLGKSEYELRQAMQASAMDTYMRVCDWSSRSEDAAPARGAYEAAVRALCDLSGQDSFDYGIPNAGEPSLGNYMESSDQITAVVHDPVAIEAADDRRQRAANEWNKVSKNEKTTIRDLLSVLRVWRIFGSLPIFASAAAEHGAGNAMANVANKVLFATGDGKAYAPTADEYKLVSSDDNIEAISAFKALQHAGGRDAILMFAETGMDYNMENVTKFIHTAQESQNDTKLHKMASKFMEISDKWMTGDFKIGDKADAKRWLQSYMTLQMAENGKTIDQVREELNNNPSRFFKEAFNSVNGYQAFVQSSNLYAARIDPLTTGMKNWFMAHGWSDAMATLIFGSPYLNYAVKAFELWLPGANTISYAMTKKLAANGTISQDVLENQLGGLSEDGLKRCLIYDVTRFGFTSVSMLSMYAAAMALGGIEPPDDEDKFLLPWEWKIGVPWSDEKLPVSQSWFMDDMLQWAAPGVVALAMAQQGYSPNQIWGCFWNGVSDIFGGNKLFGAVSSIVQLPDLITRFSKGEIDFNQMAGKKFAKTVNMLTNPMGISQFTDMMHNGDLARNASTYADDSYRNNDWERAYNQYALTNPLMAALGNFFSGKEKFGWDASGLVYAPDKEAEAMATANSYAEYLKNFSLEDTPDAKAMWAQGLLSEIEGATAEELVEKGWCIDSDTAYALLDYVGGQIDDLNAKTIAAREAYVNGSISSNQYWQYKSELDNEKDYMYAAISAVGYDGLLYDKKAYVEVYGETKYNPETDEYYNFGSYKNSFLPFTSPETGSVRFRDINESLDTGVKWGDYRTENLRDNDTAAPGRFLVPNSSTIRNEVFGKGNGAEETAGSSTGKKTGQTETDAFNEKAKAMKTAKSNALNEGLDAVGSKKSTSGGWSYGKSYGSGYSGGSGSSKPYTSYTKEPTYTKPSTPKNYDTVPKIYSVNGGNLSVNNPANIYLKSPYSTNATYLSPSVSTKGSSEGYIRRN